MGTVAKALELLDLFTRTRPRIGLSELARLSGQNKATCYRLMAALQGYGLVEQTGQGREYRLGPAVLRLAALREESVPMKDAAQPILDRLAESTGETAHLSMMMGERLQLLNFAYSQRHGTRVTMADTDTLPFHATSSGIAVLALLPAELRDRVLAAPMVRLTPLTDTDPASIRARLDRFRADGVAESAGGFETDVHSLAVPVFDAAGDCAGAVAVAAPAARMDDALRALIRAEVMRAGVDITRIWGGSLPPELATLWRAAA